MTLTITSPTGAMSLIAQELLLASERTAVRQADELSNLADLALQAERTFVFGAGRSGLALKMTAMRLMHLGLDVHVVGEVTAPAISNGDLLLTASGSGTTMSVLRAAQLASAAGASVGVITTDPHSPLATLATVSVHVLAAEKRDISDAASRQYAGSLFEQCVVVIGDALFHTLWQRSGVSADELWERHANLE
ncbi:6-phospho-3-hexuloisomerase [Agromyces sp. Soil535]|uniref:6-phospho-3-hexuloisomerase n=1 Tax=Agromyces sp. Soil535 TaxID=1736390 RepID=UPI0006FA2D15|nr:6-phospho-3-hexuloisomerase [Agromyces sp. Soil535]KRE22303.1 3-hexulose-6-phosphate isomerase [Agromyces sp. Soil535]